MLVLPGAEGVERELWYLYRGRRWAQFNCCTEDDIASMAARLERSRERAERAGSSLTLDHQTIDETVLLSRWINRSAEHPALIAWTGQTALQIVELALDVDLSLPFGESPLTDEAVESTVE